MKLMFSMFADDIGLLRNKVFTGILKATKDKPAILAERMRALFEAMSTGGYFGADEVLHFNGGLFADADVFELRPDEIRKLVEVNQLDWSDVEPSIFGTLFERILDPDKRSQIGAHYTSRADIETLLEPVVMQPLRREWEGVKAECEKLWVKVKEASRKEAAKGGRRRTVTPKQSPPGKRLENKLRKFAERLEEVTILDPACGSGNFLYVALNLLLDLNKEVISYAAQHGVTLFPSVRPTQLLGIEINEYAQELASVVIWIGYLQWMHDNGFTPQLDPVLEPFEWIRRMDAILDLTDPEHPKEPEWPPADYIVGNPPFLGDKLMRAALGDDYVEKLRRRYKERVPGQADICCYWFERARDAIHRSRTSRAGLLATQGIRGGASRTVLQRIKDSGDIFFAVSDREWVLEEASVHVSLVGFDDGSEATKCVDGKPASQINSNLTGALADVTAAKKLKANARVSFQGPVKVGAFEIDDAVAQKLLTTPNPNGRPCSDVLRPWINGIAITSRQPPLWIIDFHERSQEEAAGYGRAFEYVRTHVKPARDKTRRARRRELWWIHGETNNALRAAVRPLQRMISTCQTAKYRLYVWADTLVLPAQTVIAFALDDDYSLGLLHSRIHECWSFALGTQLREKESGFRYTPTTCFETFPFPEPTASQRGAIAAAVMQLDALRNNWLNPPEWTWEEVLEFPGSMDGPWARYVHDPNAHGIGTVRYTRLVPRDEDCASELKKRTLTNLYNQRPTWLDLAHKRLDEAVAAAYGWPPDFDDEQILENLLELNLQRAAQS